MKNNSFRGVGVILVAVVLLGAISLLPLEKMTGGLLNDFNLLSDIQVEKSQERDEIAASKSDVVISEEEKQDTTVTGASGFHAIDTLPRVKPESVSPRVGDVVVLEDYTEDGTGLKNFRNSLSRRDSLGRPVRIAFLGDSYIEGDIFTQHIRQLLQDKYGGMGVGYMNMYSEFPGFRKSVRQSGSGWETHDIEKNNAKSGLLTLAQEYFVSSGKSKAVYKGTEYARHLDSWTRSSFLFIAKEPSIIKTRTSSAAYEYIVSSSDSVQCRTVEWNTQMFSLECHSGSLIGLGVWLDGDSGIAVDCMSSRGSSGMTLTRINRSLCRQLSRFIHYDLIILEYGINAMTSGQTNFNGYVMQMEKVVAHLRDCFPDADILIMGIGDRGEKRGTEYRSMPNVPLMVAAQRSLAQKMGCLFWDTREAMGGEDAAIKWANHKPAYVNKDYIHLSYKGGEALAVEFVKSLNHAIGE